MRPLLVLFPLLLSLSWTLPISAQENPIVVILSKRVGPVIDSTDRERFRIFSQIEGFRRAVAVQRSPGHYEIRFDCVDRNGQPFTLTVEYSEQGIRSLAEKINHFEDLAEGRYQMGSDPPRFELATGDSILLKAPPPMPSVGRPPWWQPSDPTDLLPFSDADCPAVMELYPRVGFALGVSTFSPHLGGVNDLLQVAEDYYRNQGYAIYHSEITFSPSPILWYALTVRASQEWAALLEAGQSKDGDAFLYRTASISVIYYPEFLRFGVVQPFLGMGATQSGTKIQKGARHSDVVSAIDTAGRYTRLDGFGINGGQSDRGWSFTFGVDVGPAPQGPAALRFFAKYNNTPPIRITFPLRGTADVTVGGLVVGVSALLIF